MPSDVEDVQATETGMSKKLRTFVSALWSSRLGHRFAAWGMLLGHYKRTFARSWEARKRITPPKLEAHESEFLPSALSLQTTPLSPTATWLGRILIALVCAILLWSVLGRMEIVVNASGRIIPSARSKVVSAVETSKVERINVREGMTVRKGDILLELDTRMSDRDRDRATSERDAARLLMFRGLRMLASLKQGRLTPIGSVEGVPASKVSEAESTLEGYWVDYTAKLSRINAEIARYSKEIPLMTRRVSDYESLATHRDISVHSLLERKQELVELEGKLLDAQAQRAALAAETRKSAEDMVSEGRKQMASLEQEIAKASARSDMQILRAPIDGTVQQLNIVTIGGVVAAAQPLMTIVPLEGPIEIEAFVENKDIGFVKLEQPAAIKIEAFDYTKYGTIAGKVTNISRDAMNSGPQGAAGRAEPSAPNGQTEQRSAGFMVNIQPDKPLIDIAGKQILLTPGMSVSVELKTGSRRVIEYFLSPLIQYTHESLTER